MRNLSKQLRDYDVPYVTKTVAPTTSDTGYATPTMWINTVAKRAWVHLGGGTWREVSSDVASMTTSTDPATNAAVTTAIIDAYRGVIITLTGAGNSQTLQDPTETTAGRRFTVVNNDTSSDTISVNGIVLSAGEAQGFIWDGTAWMSVTAVDAEDISFTPAGNLASTDVQAAIEELDTEKLAVADNLSDVNNAVTSFTNIKQSATESATGVAELSTDAETVTGTDTDRVTTPSNISAKMKAPGAIGQTTPSAGFFTHLQGRYMSGEVFTDSYNLSGEDFGRSLRMNSADDEIFGLPSVGSSDDGALVEIVAIGTGKVTVSAADSDKIASSDTAPGSIFTPISGENSSLNLEYVHAITTWVPRSGFGTWETT